MRIGLVLAGVPNLLFVLSYVVLPGLSPQNQWSIVKWFALLGSCATLISSIELLLASSWSLRKRDLLIYLSIPIPYGAMYLFLITIAFCVAWSVAHPR
jgi:hypothetical protein